MFAPAPLAQCTVQPLRRGAAPRRAGGRTSRLVALNMLPRTGRIAAAPCEHIAEVIDFLRMRWPAGGAAPPAEPLRLAVCRVYPREFLQYAGEPLQDGMLVANTGRVVEERAF